MNDISTIEDCLEVLVGLQFDYKFNVNSSDINILTSIARQVFRNIPLTDRQYKLVSTKLSSYKDQFDSNGIPDIESACMKLRMPLREIDRSKYIKVVDTLDVYKDTIYESYKADWEWIKIRFPFSKKDIIKVEEVVADNKIYYEHQRGSHEHYFRVTENTVYGIIKSFKNKNFIIDQDLLDLFDEISQIKDNAKEHIPCISGFELHNISPSLLKTIKEETTDIKQVIDRRRRYSIDNFDISPSNSLVDNICYRDDKAFDLKPSMCKINEITDVLYNLDRFPLLVILDQNDAEEQVYEFYNSIKNLIPNEEQSVLFRQEGQTNFNDFVKNNKLNNWVDKNTKIVYTCTNKLPKILFTADWSPIAAFAYNSSMNRFLSCYVANNCDLIVYYDENVSPFRRFSNLYEV